MRAKLKKDKIQFASMLFENDPWSLKSCILTIKAVLISVYFKDDKAIESS